MSSNTQPYASKANAIYYQQYRRRGQLNFSGTTQLHLWEKILLHTFYYEQLKVCNSPPVLTNQLIAEDDIIIAKTAYCQILPDS